MPPQDLQLAASQYRQLTDRCDDAVARTLLDMCARAYEEEARRESSRQPAAAD
ncbi:MAG TPA: hypothetical protein VF727_04935 [Allosphingosinicella sp.]|jgi:hypothetical protein